MLALIAGVGIGLGLAVHEIFFVVPLIIGFAALGSKIHSFVQRQMRRDSIVDLVRAGAVEDWALPHLSRLASRLGGEDNFLHPHHRVRFAKCH